MDNWLMIFISVGMIVLFIGPFVLLSSNKGRHHQKARRKQ